MSSKDDIYCRYYSGHRGQHGNEFLEMEIRPDGKVGSLIITITPSFISPTTTPDRPFLFSPSPSPLPPFTNKQLRYANSSKYKDEETIRKECYISQSVLKELKRIIETSNILNESDDQWPDPSPSTHIGIQELEIVLNGQHISFATAIIGSMLQIQSSKDPEGLTMFYYLVQDLKVLVHSLFSCHHKIRPI